MFEQLPLHFVLVAVRHGMLGAGFDTVNAEVQTPPRPSSVLS